MIAASLPSLGNLTGILIGMGTALLIYCASGDCCRAYLPHVWTWVFRHALDYTTGLLKGAGVNAEPVHKGSVFSQHTVLWP